MSWGKWFTGDSSDKASFKTGIDDDDGSFRTERMVRESGQSKHSHEVAKGSSDGTQYTEIYKGANATEKGNESYK